MIGHLELIPNNESAVAPSMKLSARWKCVLVTLVCLAFCSAPLSAQDRGEPWVRHTIDSSSRGADGVRLADVNEDGLIDMTTGWEQGGVVRVYLNPGPDAVKQAWPAVSVGEVGSPEDAVFADVDGDGAIDVISSCEGKIMSMFVHWAPTNPAQYLDPTAWQTSPIPITDGLSRWMFCLPFDIDHQNGIDLMAGSKNPNGVVGWLEAPKNARDLAAWKWHPLYQAGWIMSLIAEDVDADGDMDVILTDRKESSRAARWLENPGVGAKQRQPWPMHLIGGADQEIMFLVSRDLDGDGLRDFVAAVKDGDILFFQRQPGDTPKWETHTIPMPPNSGTGKGAEVGDIDLDGQADVVFSCEHSEEKTGVAWLSWEGSPTTGTWTAHEISGMKEGVKFDLLHLLDLDADGDLDAVTCEERHNLGIIWYENPTR